jgi:hypothetical protein
MRSIMGRSSREHRERRERRSQSDSGNLGKAAAANENRSGRAEQLERELERKMGGEAVFWTSRDCPEDVRVSDLEDVLAFESVGSGPSLFEGLQKHGIDLQPPEKLDEAQSAEKVMQVMHALARLRIFLVGWEGMTAREFYSTLWRETLWEGCYVEKRNSGALTLIDVSHKLSPSDFQRYLEEMQKSDTIH